MITVRLTHQNDTIDTLLCSGHFNSVYGIRDGQVYLFKNYDQSLLTYLF